MTITIICSLLFVLIVYLYIGMKVGRHNSGIADLLPLSPSRRARVNNSAEFSSSTVATSISFATVIIAFFELAGYFGLWLLWAVVTTAIGLLVVRLFAKRIWDHISKYKRRPTLHDFLGDRFNSKTMSQVGAVCTSLGFLGAFAAELTVGSRFFSGLIPAVPSWIIVVALSTAAFIYTAFGGFRAVIVTDRVQMISIWLLILSMPVFYIYYILTHGGWQTCFNNMPASVLSFTTADRAGLTAFMVGIFVINVPAFISDMSVWQRISGAQDSKTVTKGLLSGIFTASITWTALVFLACFVFMIVTPDQGVNPLIALVRVVGSTGGFFATTVLFVMVIGLYGAMLSTASTQLIAVSHTLYVDVFLPFFKHEPDGKVDSKKELNMPRIILVVAAVVSTLLVQLLSMAGFTIADLVFAIYGAQLGLCPLVVIALLVSREKLKRLAKPAVIAVSAGFIVGWGAAVFGKLTSNGNLIFLSPVCSLSISSIILALGVLLTKKETTVSENVNWILIKSVIKARKNGLYHLIPADKPMRLRCLKDACAICCKAIGTPVITQQEAETIGIDSVIQGKGSLFLKSENCVCKFLENGLCSIHPIRPKGCREYPWYNIDGKLYYDKGCPGVEYDKDERPDVNEIQPFENFFPHTPKVIVWIIKKICISSK